MPFKRIEGVEQIRSVMHAHMLAPGEQRAPFLATIKLSKGQLWNGHVATGGAIIEGARPLSAYTDDGDTTYTLTNSDSGYCQPIGTVKLSGLDYVEVLQ